MISKETFSLSRNKYGRYASWAIWAPGESTANMECLSMFEHKNIEKTLKQLHTRYVVVGLNISTEDITKNLSNFHGNNGKAYKARLAFKDTPLWGSYMTDFLKDFKCSNEKEVAEFIKKGRGKRFLVKSGEDLSRELKSLGASNAKLIALGSVVESMLKQIYPEDMERICKIHHYGCWLGPEDYRDKVHNQLREHGILKRPSVDIQLRSLRVQRRYGRSEGSESLPAKCL